MNYQKNTIDLAQLVGKLSAHNPNINAQNLLANADSSLVADTDNYRALPQYFDFSTEDERFVVDVRNERIENIYTIPEGVSDYEYPCVEVFLDTLSEWSDDVESMKQLYNVEA